MNTLNAKHTKCEEVQAVDEIIAAELDKQEESLLNQIIMAEIRYVECQTEDCQSYWIGVINDLEAKLSDVRKEQEHANY
jgi:hypothetical protein